LAATTRKALRMTLSSNFDLLSASTRMRLTDFRTIFQLDSILYNQVPEELTNTHPSIDLSVAVMKGLHPDAEEINDNSSSVERISLLINPHGQSIIYGEYRRKISPALPFLDERRAFLTMIDSQEDPDLAAEEDPDAFEDPYVHVPHVTFHGRIEKEKGQEYLRPLGMSVGLGVSEDDVLDSIALETPDEFLRGLCYADATMCQIMNGQTLTPVANARWLRQGDPLHVTQKVDWMKTRNYQDLVSHLEYLGSQKKSRAPAARGPSEL